MGRFFGPYGDGVPTGPKHGQLEYLLQFCEHFDIKAQPLASAPDDNEPDDEGDVDLSDEDDEGEEDDYLEDDERPVSVVHLPDTEPEPALN